MWPFFRGSRAAILFLISFLNLQPFHPLSSHHKTKSRTKYDLRASLRSFSPPLSSKISIRDPKKVENPPKNPPVSLSIFVDRFPHKPSTIFLLCNRTATIFVHPFSCSALFLCNFSRRFALPNLDTLSTKHLNIVKVRLVPP